MNYICTWFCADEKGEESIFPQTGESSSSQKHQDIYWRCIILFYITSRRFNKTEKHLFFTNVNSLPIVDGHCVATTLAVLGVDIVFTDFKYKTPKGYFQMFQNQFYEFSILEHITKNNKNLADTYMIVDSDCIFMDAADKIFKASEGENFLSFEDDCTTELVIHGLSRIDMKNIYEELLERKIDEIPGYHLGEFFLANVKNIQTLFGDFLQLWPVMMQRFEKGLPKFNEEAQTLSFLYFKNNFEASPSRKIMKRFWTNPTFYRNVEPTDADIILWHLPSEKTYGLADLYKILVIELQNYGNDLSEKAYAQLVGKTLGIPYLSVYNRLKYYYLSYYRAIYKKLKLSTFVHKLNFNKNSTKLIQ